MWLYIILKFPPTLSDSAYIGNTFSQVRKMAEGWEEIINDYDNF